MTVMKTISDNKLRYNSLLFMLLTLLSIQSDALSSGKTYILLEKNNFKIVLAANEAGPVKMAVEALKRDFQKVMGVTPQVVNKISYNNTITEIVVVNRTPGRLNAPLNSKKPDGFESHRIYSDLPANKIYLEGFDMRGTIFAIYTFSEQILGVPPLYAWSSWIPVKREQLKVPADLDISLKSPQVRYRALLPGDQDFFNPWRKLSEENDNVWLETALRLKLNSVETYSTILPDYKLTDYAYQIDRFGLVITSHHTSGLNTSFATWETYWEKVRKKDPPKLLLANEQAILDFFRYNAETVKKSGIENLWTIAFRGKTDQPFWSVFDDAPKEDKDRAVIINKMLRIQLDMIKEVTGNPNPYVRITFYDEMADLMAKGYLKPPEDENIIWTYVAARRDPYPYADLVNFNSAKPIKLGYYMNFGFASTGPHVAPAEGPWKMEFNYRYINNKSPLFFSVVNVGNVREFLLELSANAKMLWDYSSYNSDLFLADYCVQYFGNKFAPEVAQLYKDYYNAYWIPKKTEMEGLERQFLFQDLRYARVFDQINKKFYSAGSAVNLNPLTDIGYERTPGRTFRIDAKFNNSDNQVDAILYGMYKTIPRFESVAARCTEMMPRLDADKQTFFNDNLRLYSYYMAQISKTLYHYVLAYKSQHGKEVLIKNLDSAYMEASLAKKYLYEGQHGNFYTWYSGADPLKRTFQINSLLSNIKVLKQHALNKK